MAEKKKPGVVVRKSTTTAKSAKEAAYGKREVIYEKPKKPVKNVNSSDYQGMTKEQKNTKAYKSTSDAASGKMTETLKGLGKAKTKNLTNKEAMYATENPKAKGKDFTKATISNVNQEAYNRVMTRAAASGRSAADAKKAIDAAIRTTSAGLKSDRDKVAMRFKMQESKKKKAAQDKIKRGY
jgi:hypothetical protein